MSPNTIFVLNRNYLGEAEGSILEATSVPNIFRIQGTAKFVGSQYARETVVEVPTVAAVGIAVAVDTVQAPFAAGDFLNMMNRNNDYSSQAEHFTQEERDAMAVLQAHVRSININVGDSYRYYTRSTNRWDLATFEITGTDIGRIVSGFAVPSPSRKSAKRKLLKALNTVYGLLLTDDEIKASPNN